MKKLLSLSIVSHGHRDYIAVLLKQLAALGRDDFEVILTLNLPEARPMALEALPFPVQVIENTRVRGFSANHNAAFERSGADYFVILNPDISLLGDPFPALLAMAQGRPNAICAPLIVDRAGRVEDSARNFPSPFRLIRRQLARLARRTLAGETVAQDERQLMPDWAAGMFLMVPRTTYSLLEGFDESYFLYFEDVDFCARARLAGCDILVNKQVRVVHEAQRDSHRKLRYLLWHMHSALKFFFSRVYLQTQYRRLCLLGNKS